MKQIKFNEQLSQEQIVNFLKNYGFVFPDSEIYGGLANTWDFGPLGVLLKRNIKNLWWNEFVTKDPQTVGIDSAIINNPKIWKASGHLVNFSDPLIECKNCHNRFRADKLINDSVKNAKITEQTSFVQLEKMITDNKISCPICKQTNWAPIHKFNLMFQIHQGILADDHSINYLRPETAQGIFVNFLNVQRSLRLKIPFGIAQIGKSFRNEITPGNFIFRTREFEQMELEYFVNPNEADKTFEFLLKKIKNFLSTKLKINDKNLFFREHQKDELSHYSKRTVDIEFAFPHGKKELWGIANRTDFDLNAHSKHAKTDLVYFDSTTNKKIVPFVIEPSVGVERLFYAVIVDKYRIEKINDNETREVLHLPLALAPYKIAVLPLVNKLSKDAKMIYESLVEQGLEATYDVTGSIGKRYRRQDAIGTPYCLTFDFDSLTSKTVTIRDRDTMKQKRISISEIVDYLQEANHA
ncbi:MAG: glycine--tRNA ligase [Mycoplasmataceae bacterium]|nr:glycine--tRNA ligase [Mycoplasmataceae bacterium]